MERISRDTAENTSSLVASKHRSMDLAGSVYLISSDGKLLKLPIPSTSPWDPLNWSLTKRAGVVATVVYFSVIALLSVQVPGPMFNAFLKEFSEKV